MRSLSLKLVLAFLVVSLTGTALVAIFAVLTTTAQFNRFVADQAQESVVDQLVQYYQTHGQWLGIAENLPAPDRLGSGRGPGTGPLVLVDPQGRVVIPGMGYSTGERLSLRELGQDVPIEVDGQVVGRLLVRRDTFQRALAGLEALFLTRVNRLLVLGSLGATVVAVLLGVLLARNLTGPLRELKAATLAVARGDLDQQVPVHSQDELGDLATAFNQMNAELARSRDLRRQMTADIAHDLRTPLSVILGHSEAISEGVLPPDPQTFQIIHDEAQRLNRLVDDLRILSLAEAGELQLMRRPVPPQSLLKRAMAAHMPKARQENISLELETAADGGLPEVVVDPDRIAQVLDNLLSNAMRFTPAGGCITLSARPDGSFVRLAVQDTGPGIPPDELPYIFERFYRSDRSRQRHEGGSGLGLAIARSLVEAHGGHVTALSEPGLGVRFVIELPIDSGGPANS